MEKLTKINKRLLFALIMAYLLAMSLYGYWDYTNTQKDIMAGIDKELYNSAKTLKFVLPDNFHDRAVDPESLSVEDDKAIATKLTMLVKETGFKYAYTIVKQNDILFFVASDITADPGTKRGTFYFYKYEDADESFFKAFEQKEPTYKTVSDQWGTVRTVMIPEQSKNGVKYLACVDYDISHVNEVLYKNLVKSIATLLFFLLLAVPILIIYLRLHRKYWESLQESEKRFRSLFEQAAIGVSQTETKTGKYIRINQRFCDIVGYAPDEMARMNFQELTHPDDLKKDLDNMQKLILGEIREYSMEKRYFHKNGSTVWVSMNVSPMWEIGQEPDYHIAVVQDITDRKSIERHLQKAQKMESIGNLAGGIAHDFNNILFPIVGMAELLLDDLHPGSHEYENVQQILKAGNRGSELVKQILTFSRQSEQKTLPTRIQSILKEVIKLCRSTIPSYIDLQEDIQSECGFIMADPTQIHQVAMNIITNAYHAMGANGGRISIYLKETVLEASDLPNPNLEPGKYVLFSVSDTGDGIPEENMDKIFDPYFTTKEKGKGTGLGLAVVHGIVREHGGTIKVTSEIGRGSTFQVYLPLMNQTDTAAQMFVAEKLPVGDEHILLVDDEEAIAELEKQMLQRLGYCVTERYSSTDALEAFKSKPMAFDLVITDMTMPNMPGDQLAKELKRVRSDISVIICTGFSERINQERAKALGINGFLMKPVAKSKMAKTVRKVLDEAKTKSRY